MAPGRCCILNTLRVQQLTLYILQCTYVYLFHENGGADKAATGSNMLQSCVSQESGHQATSSIHICLFTTETMLRDFLFLVLFIENVYLYTAVKIIIIGGKIVS